MHKEESNPPEWERNPWNLGAFTSVVSLPGRWHFSGKHHGKYPRDSSQGLKNGISFLSQNATSVFLGGHADGNMPPILTQSGWGNKKA